jgi:hypothetical protein
MRALPIRADVRRIIGGVLRLITAAALAVDACVHADLGGRYEPNRDGGLSPGDLFRIEAAAASLMALLIVLVAWRVVWVLAFVVAASAFAAVMVYAHYDIHAIGPIPDMYEPIWYSEKTFAATVEAVAAGTAALGFALAFRPSRQAARRHDMPVATSASGTRG